MQNLFKKLNILESKNLFKFSDKQKWKDIIPARLHKGLEEINPEYFLVQKNKIITLFFDFTEGEKEEVYSKIWNFGGTPVVFIIKNGLLDIYNGFNFNIKNKYFIEIQKNINLEKDKIKVDFSLLNIFSGKIWEKNNFEKKNTVDEELLKNLKNTREILIEKNNLDEEITTNIIGRLLFSRYLVDRGVKIDNKFQKYFEAKTEFAKLILEKEKLYEYFEYLKETFNGDLFPVLEGEKEKINKKHLYILFYLFNGDEVGNGKNIQKSLFNLYDFKIIPIELISEIYEQFMGAKQGETSAFYTPSFLVDYILEKTVKKHLEENNECRVFDPSCGSGIFLVESLRQIIETNIDDLNKLEKENKITEKIEKLKNIIIDNIFGVDLNEQAINVTIFSLCLTMLDYIEPKDITKFRFPTLKNKNLFISDFFDLENEFNSEIKNINFILGNPPWGSYGKKQKAEKHLEYIEILKEKYNEKKVISDFQIAESFILRTKEFSNKNTKNALILPSKILYNYTAKEFRNIFISNFIITEILELSPVRKKLFSGAIAPTFISFFQYEEKIGKIEKNIVIHKSIKPNLFLNKLQLLVIEKNDIKNVQQKYFLKYEKINLWKILLYGNILDFHLIKRLNENYSSIDKNINNKKIESGVGYKEKDGNKKYSTKSVVGKVFININKKELKRYSITSKNKWIEKDVGNFPQKKGLFDIGPKILIKEGLELNGLSIVSSYTEKDYFFAKSITSIFGKNKILLKSITGTINSNFGNYYLIQQGSYLGTEREIIIKKDILNIPVLDDIKIANFVDKIQKKYIEINELDLGKEEVKNNQPNLFDKNSSQDLEKKNKLEKEKNNLENKLNNVVLESFDFSESDKDLLNYTKEITIPLINNDKTIFEEAGEEYLKKYAKLFLDYFGETWNGENGKYFYIDIYKDKHLVGVNFKVEKTSRKNKINFIDNKKILDEFKNLINLGGDNKITDTFYENRDIRGFNKNNFYIIKYNQKKNWHKGVGQVDLSEFIGAMMKSGIKKINNK